MTAWTTESIARGKDINSDAQLAGIHRGAEVSRLRAV